MTLADKTPITWRDVLAKLRARFRGEDGWAITNGDDSSPCIPWVRVSRASKTQWGEEDISFFAPGQSLVAAAEAVLKMADDFCGQSNPTPACNEVHPGWDTMSEAERRSLVRTLKEEHVEAYLRLNRDRLVLAERVKRACHRIALERGTVAIDIDNDVQLAGVVAAHDIALKIDERVDADMIARVDIPMYIGERRS